ncbi:Hypothetical protein, conserved [Brucella suis ATCC 23445]|uniref:Uncharacterized protein n=1 Tax=Brucella suis (strain ATCC 23445 / NCTC 10510) TaxID=470137 RepID=B0CHT8_BRUSI|nr:Hypothetical protein, conserved [Brucella suis ATCC 23445]
MAGLLNTVHGGRKRHAADTPFRVQSVPTNVQAIGTGSMIHISPQGREFTAAYFF